MSFDETCNSANVCERDDLGYDPQSGFPNADDPNNTVAPWWDDMILDFFQTPLSAITYATLGTSPNREFVVEWSNIRHYEFGFGSSSHTNYQVRLAEGSNSIKLAYGAYVSDPLDDADWSGTMGVENEDATIGLAPLTCATAGPVTYCGFSTLESLEDQVIEFSVPNTPELVGSLTSPTGADPGGSVSVPIEVRNLGPQPATPPFAVDVYLSNDTLIDPLTDRLLGTAMINGVAAQSTVMATLDATVDPATPPGYYILGAVIDATDQIVEAVETNNTAVANTLFLVGADVGVAIDNVPSTGPEETITFPIHLLNNGAPLANVEWSVHLSTDGAYDPADPLLAAGSTALAAVPDTTIEVTATIPANTLTGDYYLIARVDPNGAISEADETNNDAATPDPTQVTGPDVATVSVTGDHFVFRGEPYTVTLTLHNDGASNARDFYSSLHLSDNQLITFTDYLIGETGPITLGPGETRVLVETYTISSTLTAGLYFLGAIADDRTVILEPNENNNVRFNRDQVEVRDVAPDFAAADIASQATGAAGESFVVERTLANAGNALGALDYEIYLSPDQILDPASDYDLGQLSTSLGPHSEDHGVDNVRIPAQVTGGHYYLIYALDPSNTVAELFEDNNVTISEGTINVLPAQLTILTRELPLATVNLPYAFVLAVAGGAGAYTWTIDDGALPPGLALDDEGRISGTPTEEGTFPLTVSVNDGTLTVSRAFTLIVAEEHAPLEVATRALIPAFVGREYNYPLTAFGGVPPYSWSADRSLPGGLLLTPSGAITGVPGEAALDTVNFSVTDATGAHAERPLVVRVVRDDAAVRFTNDVLPDGTLGAMYDEDVRVEPGTGESPFVFDIASGALPPGLELQDNRVVGVPTMVGSFTVGIRVVDNRGDSDLNLFIVTVNEADGVTISTSSLPEGTVGQEYKDEVGAPIRIKAFAQNGTGVAISFSIVAGALPAGLTLDTDGILHGTPTSAGVSAFLVIANDEAGQADHRALGIAINPAPIEEPKPIDTGSCGCSTTSRLDGGGAWLLAGLALLLVARRRWWAIAALTLIPSLAQAQMNGPYFVSTSNRAYVSRSGGTQIPWFSNDDDQAVVTLPFAFRLYSQTYTEVSIGTNGIVSFDIAAPLGTVADSIPDSFEPNSYIATFWDDLVVGSGTTIVEGTAPNRVFIIQYESVERFFGNGGTTNFQIHLYEGQGGKIEVAYGAATNIDPLDWSASAGIEDDTGSTGFYFFGCGDNCDGSQLVAAQDTVITAQQDAGEDVIPGAITAPAIVYAGVPFNIDLSMMSFHNAPLGPFRYTVHLGSPSDDHPFNPIYISQPTTLSAYQSLAVNTSTAIPFGTPEGRYRLALEVDSDNAIMEPDESNFVFSGELRVAPPQPDFRVEEVAPDVATAAPGDSIHAIVTFENAGNLDGSAHWAVYLSRNSVVSIDDLEVANGMIDLPKLTTSSVTADIALPASLQPGEYWIGAVIDAENAVRELSEINNARATLLPISVATDSVAVLTASLPSGYVGVDYDAYLTASGGDGSYAWSLLNGSLPVGLTLVGSTGEIRGAPMTAGDTAITVKVTSDGRSATADLTISVAEIDVGLVILTRELLPGVIGVPYPPSEQKIAVAGGSGPITFSLDGDAPAGLTLDPDGLLHGTPVSRGVYDLHVEATDGTATAARTLRLTIAEPGRLTLIAAVLPDGVIGQEYSYVLQTIGHAATATLTFSSAGSPPPGIVVQPSGRIAGVPEVAGTWQFSVNVVEGDAADAPRDSATFVLAIAPEPGFRINPDTLPDATAGTMYEVKLNALGGQPPLAWRFEGNLPGGLTSAVETQADMREALVIRGTPDGEGFTTMLVSVDDAVGRHASMPFALRVLPEPVAQPPPVETGCGCTTSDREHRKSGIGSLGLLMLAVLAISRRRRSGSR